MYRFVEFYYQPSCKVQKNTRDSGDVAQGTPPPDGEQVDKPSKRAEFSADLGFVEIFQTAAVAVDKTDDLPAADLARLFKLAAQAHPGRTVVAAGHPGGQGELTPPATLRLKDDAVPGDIKDLVGCQTRAGGGQIGNGGGHADIRRGQTDRDRFPGFVAVGAPQLPPLPDDSQAAQRQQQVEGVPNRANEYRVPEQWVGDPAPGPRQIARHGQQEHPVERG